MEARSFQDQRGVNKPVLLAPCISRRDQRSPWAPQSPQRLRASTTGESAGWLMFGARAGGLAVALLITFKSRCPSRPSCN